MKISIKTRLWNKVDENIHMPLLYISWGYGGQLLIILLGFQITISKRNVKRDYYEYKGNQYTAVDNVLSRCRVNGEWYTAKMYKRVSNGKTKYVREINDFESKFKWSNQRITDLDSPHVDKPKRSRRIVKNILFIVSIAIVLYALFILITA